MEANTQEYAFNFLQQSLKNKIQDAEVGPGSELGSIQLVTINKNRTSVENIRLLTCSVMFVQENLEKQSQHSQTLAEKLWLTERKVEDLEVDKETRDKKTCELNNTVLRLETEVQPDVHPGVCGGSDLLTF